PKEFLNHLVAHRRCASTLGADKTTTGDSEVGGRQRQDGLVAARTIDFHTHGTRPAPAKRTSSKPLSTKRADNTGLEKNFMCPPSLRASRWRSSVPLAAKTTFFSHPWYGVERITMPPCLRALRQPAAQVWGL